MPLYDLPVWATDVTPFPPNGVRGVGWKLTTVEIPYCKIGSKAWLRHFESMREKYPRYSVHSLSGLGKTAKPRIAPQIIAEAKSRTVAQKAFELLVTAIAVVDGSILFRFEGGLVVPCNRNELEDLHPDSVIGASHHTLSRDNVAFASEIAAALSRRQFLSYAAFKLTLSYEIASAHWLDFHPRYSRKLFGVSRSLADHVRMASAITLAYSAIEELQLEPRSKNNRAVKLQGSWDPIALADIQKRLGAAHVNLTQPQVWTMRGSQTRIHKSDRAPSGTRLSWTKGAVRDKAVKIEDALVGASWLRSKCSTHKYQPQTKSITMYDVANVQNLARRLLLERTGFWSRLRP